MRVIADTETCQAYGNCLLEAPDVFDLDDETAAVVVLQANPPEELRPAVEAAVRSCPVQALTLQED
jgi:ferredoxin